MYRFLNLWFPDLQHTLRLLAVTQRHFFHSNSSVMHLSVAVSEYTHMTLVYSLVHSLSPSGHFLAVMWTLLADVH